MEKITILSPHCDDAVFSLGLTLGLWSMASLHLQVLNFFTESAYAPHAPVKTVAEISAIRKAEDERAIAFIHDGIKIISLDLLDAPLRLHLPFSQITQLQSVEQISPEELRQLSQHIQQHCLQSLAIAPLGLGNHVDHMAVQKASIACLPPQDLAFYEDLPYITWTSAFDVQIRIKSIEDSTGVGLSPLILRTQNAVAQKRQIASFYQSQITLEEADTIAGYAECYGSGERLWLPTNSERWAEVLDL
ncbi:MAG: PIG-L family deacetylase [Acidobacteriaceae bacterium]|nr:PIG-L family deacetylase [Acidobacteriaceae bacterium]